MSEKYFYLPRVRLYSDNKRDREILNWLEALANGFKGDSIKDAIWASIRGIEPVAIPKPKRFTESPPHSYGASPSGNGTMHGSLSLDTRELLADIRQIIEVSVAQGFAHHGGASFGKAVAPSRSDEVEALLDNIDMSFMIDDDDDEEE